MGQKMHSVGAEDCLKAAANAIEWGKNMKTEGVWKRGKGIALGNKFSLTKTASEAVVKVYGNGTIEVRTNATDMGQGTFTVLAQIAAEEFKVPLEQVKVSYGDTAIYGFAHGAFSSRQTFNDGNAVRLACIDAKRQIFEHASKVLDASPQDLETSNGEIYVKNRPKKKIGIGDLFTKLVWCTLGVLEEGGEILGKATWYSPGAPMDPETGQSERSATFYMYNSQAVEVAVNTETGEVKVLKHVSAGDCGKAINPSGVEAQLEGGIHQIIGMSLSEEVLFDNEGRTLNPEFKDYKLPTALDQPKCEDTIPLIVEKPHNKGPYRAKGIGEVVLTAGCPAIANAIYNAVGVRVHDLPIKAEKIFSGLSKKGRNR
jgi:carbon-monoxide dehydrogenase large subunit